MTTEEFATSIETSLVNAIKSLGLKPGNPPTKNYVQAPEDYDGTRANYETFRRTLELHVKGIPGDRNKILAALGFLTKGDADAWAQNWGQLHDLDSPDLKWSDFLRDLDEKFLDPRIAEHAREAISKLTQGRGDADTFFLKFDELRIKAGFTNPEYHDIVLVDYLRRNLKPALVLAVMQSHEIFRTTSLATVEGLRKAEVATEDKLVKMEADAEKPLGYFQFRKYALEQDPIIRRHGDHAPATNSTQRPAAKPFAHHYTERVTQPVIVPAAAPASAITAPATTGPAHDPDPMDVDRHRARTLGLCYRCKKPGHLARDCQERNFKDVIRGLSTEDMEEIARMVEGKSTLLEEHAEEAEDKDFSAPQ